MIGAPLPCLSREALPEALQPKEQEMSNARAGDRVLGSLRSAEGKGIVRIEDRLDARVDDVWSALTDPHRLAGWLGEVEGDLRVGGHFRARFVASGWEGMGRVEACEPARRLLVLTRDADEPNEDSNEVTLTADGDQTILVVEQRGLTWTYSLPIRRGYRSTLRTWSLVSLGVSVAKWQRLGGTSSFPPIKRWPPTSARETRDLDPQPPT